MEVKLEAKRGYVKDREPSGLQGGEPGALGRKSCSILFHFVPFPIWAWGPPDGYGSAPEIRMGRDWGVAGKEWNGDLGAVGVGAGGLFGWLRV